MGSYNSEKLLDTGKRGIDNKSASNKPSVFPCGLIEAAYFNVAKLRDKKRNKRCLTVSVRILLLNLQFDSIL